MEKQSRFKIVFEKLAEARRDGAITEVEVARSAELREESEAIAELRRMVNEISEPEPTSFSST